MLCDDVIVCNHVECVDLLKTMYGYIQQETEIVMISVHRTSGTLPVVSFRATA